MKQNNSTEHSGYSFRNIANKNNFNQDEVNQIDKTLRKELQSLRKEFNLGIEKDSSFKFDS